MTLLLSATVQNGSACPQNLMSFLEKSKDSSASGAQKLLAIIPWLSSHKPVDMVRWLGHVFVMKAFISPGKISTMISSETTVYRIFRTIAADSLKRSCTRFKTKDLCSVISRMADFYMQFKILKLAKLVLQVASIGYRAPLLTFW